MEHSLWEGKDHSAGQEIPRLLWNLKVHHCVRKSLPLDSILNHLNTIYKIPPDFSHLQLGLPSCLFPCDFPTKMYAFIISPCIIQSVPLGTRHDSMLQQQRANYLKISNHNAEHSSRMLVSGFRVTWDILYMCRPSHPLWFEHPNSIWWRAQIMKLLIVQFSPAPCYFPVS
jgi:hypothetical protein